MIYELPGRRIEFWGGHFIAESAQVIEVFGHSDASVWFRAVIRADNDGLPWGGLKCSGWSYFAHGWGFPCRSRIT